MTTKRTYYLYVGTYTSNLGFVDGRAEGIYLYKMDAVSGEITFSGVTKGIANPSYLTFHSNRSFLYAVNELSEYAGEPGGSVSAFSLHPQTGALTLLNQQPTGGTSPCYVAVDRSGEYLLVANYGSGNFTVFPVGLDGRVGEATDHYQDTGSGVDRQRQEGPHAHSINMDPTNRYAIGADLGIDQLMIFEIDWEHGKLLPHATPSIAVKAGSGPRHLDFHPGGEYAYLINELNSTIIGFSYDPQKGILNEFQTVSTLPAGYTGHNQCADIHVHPSGKFLYGSNRGHDSIVMYSIDDRNGQLAYLGNVSTQGKTPRNFAIDPTGAFLYAANQDSSSIVTFRIDEKTGTLEQSGQLTATPTPVCLKFIEM